MSSLFTPFTCKSLTVANRFAMAPMTRMMSPNQTPNESVAEYYRKRAAGGVGLVITEGTTLRSHESTMGEGVPKIVGDTTSQWQQVCDAVHAEGGKVAVQIWHVGALRNPETTANPDVGIQSPSGKSSPRKTKAEPLSEEAVTDIVEDYRVSAHAAVQAGFDAIELHGAHGYLIDQFLWEGTNQRSDRYGGDALARSQFVREVVGAVRSEVGEDYPIILRMSQWKQQDYAAKLAETPEALETLLGHIGEAGVDIFHCSTRRYWEPEFEGSPLNFAGWARKLTGKPAITVGSVGLTQDFGSTYNSDDTIATTTDHLNDLEQRVDNGEFDMVAVGRSLISNPDWVKLVEGGQLGDAKPYARSQLAELV